MPAAFAFVGRASRSLFAVARPRRSRKKSKNNVDTLLRIQLKRGFILGTEGKLNKTGTEEILLLRLGRFNEKPPFMQ
jgi:hypothetical protein